MAMALTIHEDGFDGVLTMGSRGGPSQAREQADANNLSRHVRLEMKGGGGGTDLPPIIRSRF